MDPLKTMVMTMSNEDIQLLWSYCADEWKRRQERKGVVHKQQLRNGHRVSFSGEGRTVTGTVTRVKRVKALIKSDCHQTWDVRLGNLTKIA